MTGDDSQSASASDAEELSMQQLLKLLVKTQAAAAETQAGQQKTLDALAKTQAAAAEAQAGQQKTLDALAKTQAGQKETLDALVKTQAGQQKTLDTLANTQARQQATLDNLVKNQEEAAARQERMLAELQALSGLRGAPTGGPPRFQATLEATPSKPQSHSRVPCAESYKSLAFENLGNIQETGVDNILDMLGGSWLDAWQSALNCEGIYSDERMEDIAGVYSGRGPAEGAAPGFNAEDVYQDRLNHLMLAISQFLPARLLGDPAGVRWVDTHANPMPDGRKSNGRKPDGLIVLCDTGDTPQWYHTVAAFELKSDKHGPRDNVLVGQLLSDFRDMAENQPRRRSIGFTVSRDGKMHMYLCTQDHVYHAPVDALPGTTIETKHHTLVRLLMLVLVQLPTDLGFVVNTSHGMSGKFRAADIPGYVQESGTVLSDRAVYIRHPEAFSGRHRNAVGPRSWLYRAKVPLPDDPHGQPLHWHNCIFKFHLHRDNHSEATVHKRALDMRVPYVPQLLGSATVNPQDSLLTGEILLIEDCGEDIGRFYVRNEGPGIAHKMIDFFAGYVHALLVAATGNGTDFILHRDISMGNLMVDREPALIDWGCGVVAPCNERRTPAPSEMVGTAPYMSLRVLCKRPRRSVIDDLESLFLVLTHCLASRHAHKKATNVSLAEQLAKMWEGLLPWDKMASIRKDWLTSETSYWSSLQIANCPPELESLAKSMYWLLFPGVPSIDDIATSPSDSRVLLFNAQGWVNAFTDAAQLARLQGNVRLPHLEQLQWYVADNPGCGWPSRRRS
ncbi:hypothetical protein H4R19_003006 [Coemansia spiralis]|nr:hypothetical protein H4R19_003006 [Coemansia spiralis]